MAYDIIVDIGERLPTWLKPSFYGGVVIGAWAAFKTFVLFLLTPLPFTSFALTVLLAVAAGAFAGGVWTVTNRPLMKIPLIGPYVTGIVATTAYLGALFVAIFGFHLGPLADSGGLMIFGGGTVICGLVLGYILRP